MEGLKTKSIYYIHRGGHGEMSAFLKSPIRPDINIDSQRGLEETVANSPNQNNEVSNTFDCVKNKDIDHEESDKIPGHNCESWKISARKKRTVNTLDSTPLSTSHSCTPKQSCNCSKIKECKLRIKSLIKIINKDREAVDMKLSLFMSASSNDLTSLEPFPDNYFEDNKFNRQLIYLISEEIPSIDMFLFLLREKADEVKENTVAFIEWLIKSEDPRLESVNTEEGIRIMEAISYVPSDMTPQKMFRIKNKRNSETEVVWDHVRSDNPTKFAYRHCKVEEAHRVLHYGLHNHLDKDGTFGSGIYLTNDLSRCLGLSTPGLTWGKSILASKIKLVFISEFVCNYNVIEYSQANDTSEKPFKNYFLKRPDWVKLRYLLVYLMEPSTLPKASTP